jgi:apolipoprotein N-acyltransferase
MGTEPFGGRGSCERSRLLLLALLILGLRSSTDGHISRSSGAVFVFVFVLVLFWNRVSLSKTSLLALIPLLAHLFVVKLIVEVLIVHLVSSCFAGKV